MLVLGAAAATKIALCIASAGADLFGYLRRYAEEFTRVAARRGLAVEILSHPDPDFYPRLLANLVDETCIVHFYGYLFDLKIANTGGADINVLQFSKATTVASIGDHPFCSFMHRTVANADPRMKFIVMDGAFEDEMKAMNGALKDARYEHDPIPPPTNYDAHRVAPFAERTFDLVVPMYVRDMSDQDMSIVLSHMETDWFAEVVSATYETCRAEPHRSPFHIFDEHFFAHVGLSIATVGEHNPAILGSIMNAVTAVDAIVRQERRQEMISALLANIGRLKVALTCDPFPALKVDDNVTFLGPTSVNAVAELMSGARAILNCNPSYPTSLHERVVSGMFYGSCVISDVNQEIAQRFSPDELLLYTPGSGETIADIYASYDVRRLAAAGAAKVRSDPMYSWDGHIDRLLHVAAA